MLLEWDENKRHENIRKHHIDFAEARSLLSGPMLVRLDERRAYGEDRYVGMGMAGDLVLVMVFSEPQPDRFRIISMRKANRHEEKAFAAWLADRLG